MNFPTLISGPKINDRKKLFDSLLFKSRTKRYDDLWDDFKPV